MHASLRRILPSLYASRCRAITIRSNMQAEHNADSPSSFYECVETVWRSFFALQPESRNPARQALQI